MTKVEKVNKLILDIEADPNEDANLISDKYHTFGDLYKLRLMYNAGLFSMWSREGLYEVHKSYRHHDGELCFDSNNWFIVVAKLPNGIISNHYKIEHFHLFDVPHVAIARFPFDGHTTKDVIDRLYNVLENEDEV